MLARTDSPSFEPNDPVPVLWVFQDYDERWRFRREGAADDVAFPCRQDAVEAARSFGQLCGAYRLYLQLPHGRFTLELLNIGAAKRRSSRTNFEVERTDVCSRTCQDQNRQERPSKRGRSGITKP